MRQCPDRYTIRAGQNLPDKEFRYLRTVIVTAVSPYTSSSDLAETCVFDKQSPGPILCGSISRAPLLPKLRGQLAEFLNNPSPVGLRILFLSTCVGLRYGLLKYTSSFSRLTLGVLPYSVFGPLRPGQPSPGSHPL